MRSAAACWDGEVTLRYRRDGERTIGRDRHRGPQRVLKAHYPEGQAVCHHTLVHPSGALGGGDALRIDLQVDCGAHALLTTAAATSVHRTRDAATRQRVHALLQPGARLEWLAQPTILHPGARLHSNFRFTLHGNAQMIGWEWLALGLPATSGEWRTGELRQDIDIPGVWIDRVRLRADDRIALDSPLGWNGRRAHAIVWWAGGEASPPTMAAALVEALGTLTQVPGVAAGVSSPNPRLVVARLLGQGLDELRALMAEVHSRWRETALGLPPVRPRCWSGA